MKEEEIIKILKQIREYLSIIRNTLGWILWWVFLIFFTILAGK